LFRVLAPCPCLTVFPCVRRGSRCKQTIRITLRDAVNIAAEPAGAIANLNLAESQESGNSACAALLRAASFHASKDIVRGHVAAPIGKNDFHVPQTLRALLDHGSRAKLLSSGLRPEAMAKMARLQGDGFGERRAAKHRSLANKVRNWSSRSARFGGRQRRQSAFRPGEDTSRSRRRSAEQRRRHQDRYAPGRHAASERASAVQRGLTQLKASLHGLSRLLNLDPQQSLELADTASFFKTPGSTSAESLAAAYERRPGLKTVLAQIRVAESQKRAAADERLPGVSVNGTWILQGLTPTSMIPAYQLSASVNVPLFTGGRIRAETAAADLEIRDWHSPSAISEPDRPGGEETGGSLLRVDSYHHVDGRRRPDGAGHLGMVSEESSRGCPAVQVL